MYLLTIILHFWVGYGVVRRLRLRKSGVETFGLAYPLGLGTATLGVLLMDIFGIPLTFATTTVLFAALAAALLYPDIATVDKSRRLRWTPVKTRLRSISFSEWLMLAFIVLLMFISVWRNHYLPVTPYDAIVGIDLVAKYAAAAGRIDSGVFADLQGYMSTQPYYAPFTMLSQLIYRLAGHEFGKIWLSFVSLSLVVVVYVNLRRRIHPLLAGILVVLLITIPEMYGYTFMVQTDYANAVFVTLSVIYAFRFYRTAAMPDFWLSALLFGFGAWSRSETIGFSVLMAALLIGALWLRPERPPRLFRLGLYFFGISFFFFAIWNLYYLPFVLDYHPESYFRFGFWDYERLRALLTGMYEVIIAVNYWGYLHYYFLAVLLVNLVFLRDLRNAFLLVWIALLLLGFLVLLYHLQLPVNANISNTFRRGIFKMWPVVIYYMGTTMFFERLSGWIRRWEGIHDGA